MYAFGRYGVPPNTARFESFCANCGTLIRIGDTIRGQDGSWGTRWIHEQCLPEHLIPERGEDETKGNTE